MGSLKVWNGSAWVDIGLGTPPVARIRRFMPANQTGVVSGNFTKLSFPNESENTAPALFSYTGSQGINVALAGVYRIGLGVGVATDPTGRRAAVVTLNDGDVAPAGASDTSIIAGESGEAPSSGPARISFEAEVRLGADSTLRAYVLQTAGSTLDVLALAYGTTAWYISRVGD